MTGPAIAHSTLLPQVMAIQTVGNVWLWGGSILFVLLLLFFDLFVFHRKAHTVGAKEALGWSLAWVALALAFCAGVYFYPWPLDNNGNAQGQRLATEFLTGYVIEKALSVDNLFVILVIFQYFRVPSEFQHRVLFWGILGAMVMRAVFIISGTALLQHFGFTIYIFAAFLIFTGLKMLFAGDENPHPERNFLVRLFQRLVPSVPEFRGTAFFVRENSRILVTPLLLVLFTVEVTDLIFAVDSIPAIFGISSDPFIVYTSNIFAVLGLRAMYFLLASMIGKFHYLKIGLALVLMFVGAKMILEHREIYSIPIFVSLGIVVVVLLLTMGASLLWPERSGPAEAAAGAPPEQR